MRSRVERALRQRQLLLQRSLRDIRAGDFGDHADAHRALRIRRREIVGECGIRQAAHAAEQVQLVGADADARPIQPAHRALAHHRVVLAGAVVGEVRIERRQLVALHTVQRARFVEPAGRDPQVAIVRERGVDPRLQRGVGEVRAPVVEQRGIDRCRCSGRRHPPRPARRPALRSWPAGARPAVRSAARASSPRVRAPRPARAERGPPCGD
jgi:hypothetical protein